jgi:hypothetical protein
MTGACGCAMAGNVMSVKSQAQTVNVQMKEKKYNNTQRIFIAPSLKITAMPPPSWTTPAQAQFLATELSAYLKAKENSKKVPLTRYWNALDNRWFQNWPEEASLELSAAVPGVNRAPDELALLGTATDKRKEVSVHLFCADSYSRWISQQLKSYLRYQERLHSAGRLSGSRSRKTKSLFRVLHKTKATRNLQVRNYIRRCNVSLTIYRSGRCTKS